MTRHVLIAITALGLTVLSACSSPQYRFDPGKAVAFSEKDKKGLKVEIAKVTHNGESVQVMAIIQNNYKEKIAVKNTSMKVKFNNMIGKVNDEFASVELEPSKEVLRILEFQFPKSAPSTGTLTLMLDPVNEGTLEKPGKPVKPVSLPVEIKQN